MPQARCTLFYSHECDDTDIQLLSETPSNSPEFLTLAEIQKTMLIAVF